MFYNYIAHKFAESRFHSKRLQHCSAYFSYYIGILYLKFRYLRFKDIYIIFDQCEYVSWQMITRERIMKFDSQVLIASLDSVRITFDKVCRFSWANRSMPYSAENLGLVSGIQMWLDNHRSLRLVIDRLLCHRLLALNGLNTDNRPRIQFNKIAAKCHNLSLLEEWEPYYVVY